MRIERGTGRAVCGCAAALLLSTGYAWGQSPADTDGVQLTFGGSDLGYLRLVILFASVSLAPALLAVLTSFMRIVVVLMFLRSGLGSVQIPPTPVVIGVAIVLTVVTMAGPLGEVYETALEPLLAGEADGMTAARAAEIPLRAHFERFVKEPDRELLDAYAPAPPGEPVPLATLAAAYILSELRIAFIIGFIVLVPFLVIDLVVGGILTSLGLATVPHAVVSLPFKLLLFVMVDGWRLLTGSLLAGL